MVLTNLFYSLGWTRDDIKWLIALIASIIVGLATLSDSAAAAFAIPASALPYIRLGAFIVGIVSANYKTSGLPGRAWLLPFLLLASVGLAGCSSALSNFAKVTNTEINTVPKLKCNQTTAIVGCFTDAQVVQIETDLNVISKAGAAYTLALINVNGDAMKALPQFAVFAFEVSRAEVDIASIAGPNAEAVVAAIKKAAAKL